MKRSANCCIVTVRSEKSHILFSSFFCVGMIKLTEERVAFLELTTHYTDSHALHYKLLMYTIKIAN